MRRLGVGPYAYRATYLEPLCCQVQERTIQLPFVLLIIIIIVIIIVTADYDYDYELGIRRRCSAAK